MSNQIPKTIAVPPGETIREQMERVGISRKGLGERLGMTETETVRFLDGGIAVTSEIAEKLEGMFGVPARFWMRLEAVYRDRAARAARESAQPLRRASRGSMIGYSSR